MAFAKYRRKKTATNEFTRLTGKRAFTVFGGTKCLIVETLSINRLPVAKYAFNLYYKLLKNNTNIKVQTTCGALNCVNIEHIKGIYIPSEDDREYMRTWGKSATKEEFAHYVNIPTELL